MSTRLATGLHVRLSSGRTYPVTNDRIFRYSVSHYHLVLLTELSTLKDYDCFDSPSPAPPAAVSSGAADPAPAPAPDPAAEGPESEGRLGGLPGAGVGGLFDDYATKEDAPEDVPDVDANEDLGPSGPGGGVVAGAVVGGLAALGALVGIAVLLRRSSPAMQPQTSSLDFKAHPVRCAAGM